MLTQKACARLTNKSQLQHQQSCHFVFLSTPFIAAQSLLQTTTQMLWAKFQTKPFQSFLDEKIAAKRAN